MTIDLSKYPPPTYETKVEPRSIRGATVEKEIALHCARCNETIDEYQPDTGHYRQNAIIYLTADFEVAPKTTRRKHWDFHEERSRIVTDVDFWIRPTSIPHHQMILCYVCTSILRRFLDGLST